ncbi:MAG: Rieske (2Fe-2S) protein [Ignavibacteriales bacterium]|nr:Rieske (2Fe-2S) protein [Ignavibacteriales bacterium]
MNRKEFLISCGYGCLGLNGIAALLQGCSPVNYLYAETENNVVRISRSEFGTNENIARYIIVKTSGLQYPFALYRFSDSEFTALLLQCTHQGTELNVNGDIITCPAHGSEFKNSGRVLHGPAEEPLQSYRITTDQNNIYIHLV